MNRCPAIASAILFIAASLAASPASAAAGDASSALLKTKASASCGASTTVTAPRSGVITSAADEAALAKALAMPADNSMLLHAESKHSRWMTNITCKTRPGVAPTLPTKKTAQAAGDGNSTTSNWAGYIAATANPDGTFADWTIPEVAGPSGDASQYSSTWTGIGGFADSGTGESGGELIQAGSEQDSLCTDIIHSVCSGPETAYYAFYEQYPYEDQVEITDMTVMPGDDFWASAIIDSTTAYFAICDDTTNVCVDTQQSLAGAPGNTSEWVVERTTIDGSATPLANFGTVTFGDDTGTWFNEGSATTPEAADAIAFDMYNGTDLLASTSALDSSGEGFTVTYVASQ